MTGQTIKDMGCWGSQDGLLSPAEVEHLMSVVASEPGRHVSILEVGHYYGLSTYAICEAMRHNAYRTWSLLTVDAHIADRWVPETDPSVYFGNKSAHFNHPQVQTIIADSRGIVRLDGFDVVFYDGDHAEEQERFTRLVIDTPSVRTFVFDDRDFDVPRACEGLLRAAGWADDSPPMQRLGSDKLNPHTMTLGVWRRTYAHQ